MTIRPAGVDDVESVCQLVEWYGRLGWEEYERRAEVGFARVFFRKPV